MKPVPKYCLHKATGQAYVKIKGRRIYLGKYASPESRHKYAVMFAWPDTSPDRSVIGKRPIVYFIGCHTTMRMKIGMTSNITSRFAAIQSMCPSKLTFCGFMLGGRKRERLCHKMFSDHRVDNSEWFLLNPALRQFVETKTRHAMTLFRPLVSELKLRQTLSSSASASAGLVLKELGW